MKIRKRCKPSIYTKLTDPEKDALRKMAARMKLKHMALSTRRGYLARVAWYMLFIRTRLQPGLMRKERIEAWLSDYAKRRRSASTQNGAFNAIKFFFEEVYEIPMGEIDALRAKVAKRLRIPPERENIIRMLEKVRNTQQCHYRAMAFLIYGVGLRISEAYRLRVKDVLVKHSKLVIRQGRAIRTGCSPSHAISCRRFWPRWNWPTGCGAWILGTMFLCPCRIPWRSNTRPIP